MNLSRKEQYQAAIHEAAHAVIFAMAGLEVEFVAIAPANERRWEFVDTEGNTFNHFVGICVKKPEPFAMEFMRWNQDRLRYDTDVDDYNQTIHIYSECIQSPSLREAYDHQVRANLVGIMAGYQAEKKYANGEMSLDDSVSQGCDKSMETALAAFLPNQHELEVLSEVVSITLADAKIWRRVTRLADDLVKFGCIVDLARYLPKPVKDWPDSILTKRCPDYSFFDVRLEATESGLQTSKRLSQAEISGKRNTL